MVKRRRSSKKRQFDFERAEFVAQKAGVLAVSSMVAKRKANLFISKDGVSITITADMIIVANNGKSVWLDKETLTTIHAYERPTSE